MRWVAAVVESETSSDAELVRLAQSGDRDAFDAIDRRYRSVIVRFLSRYARGPEHADELAQQTIVRAYEMIAQIQNGGSILSWLHRIAYRLLVSESRRRRPVTMSAFDTLEVATTLPNILDKWIADESQNRFWNAAKELLSAEEYRVLWWRYRDEMSLDEIASRMDKNEVAVRVQLHRARKKLLPMFQQQD
ncbi:MAG: RNA polymerase sigma factor [Thermoguttaceae bacterium]